MATRVVIAAIGRLKAGGERDLVTRYVDRVAATGARAGLDGCDLLELPESRAATADQRRADEAQRLIARIGPAHIIALDETGETVTSDAFAHILARAARDGQRKLAYVIGGADGHGPALLSAADHRISFGRMTIAHGLVRVLLAEQIYRAVMILTGHPYHRA
jgi:23S rRNA (pseudouridine1915-N3)-methyltransferase